MIGLLQPYCPDGMVCATLAHLENEADVASCCNVVHELMPHRTPSGRNGPGGCNRFQVALRIEPQLCRNAKVASWCAHALALKRKHIHTFAHTHTHAYAPISRKAGNDWALETSKTSNRLGAVCVRFVNRSALPSLCYVSVRVRSVGKTEH